MAFGTPMAYMGFIGYAQFNFPGNTARIRAKTADVKLTQTIDAPDIIDGRWDRSLYQLGPQIVEGNVEYPAIMERESEVDPTARLYVACVGRETSGSLYGRLKSANIFNLDIHYTTQFSDFTYTNCIVNTWKFTATQSDVVNIATGIWGVSRQQASFPDPPAFSPKNTRIVTWNDAVVHVIGQDGAPNIPGDYIRTFNVNIDNHAERYYTLNGQLSPQDITVKKRDIEGSFVLMGRNQQLGEWAQTNQDRCYENSQIQFGYVLTRAECNSTFLATLPNIVFRIEEMSLTNELFETTVNFRSLANDDPIGSPLDSSTYLDTGGSVLA